MNEYIKKSDVIEMLKHMPQDMFEECIYDIKGIWIDEDEPCEDAISREQFREQMYHRCFEVDNDPNMQKWDGGNWIRHKLFEEELDNAPSVQPSRPKGENLQKDFPSLFECSVCGTSCFDTVPWDCDINFCPNCGAPMIRGESDEAYNI